MVEDTRTEAYLERHSSLEKIEKARFSAAAKVKPEKPVSETSHKRKITPLPSIKKGYIPPVLASYHDPGYPARKFPLSAYEEKRVNSTTPVIQPIWKSVFAVSGSVDTSPEKPGLKVSAELEKKVRAAVKKKSGVTKRPKAYVKKKKSVKGPKVTRKVRQVSLCSNHSEAESLIDVGSVNDLLAVESELDRIPDGPFLDDSDLINTDDPTPSR